MTFLSKTPIFFTAFIFGQYEKCKVYTFLVIKEEVLRGLLKVGNIKYFD